MGADSGHRESDKTSGTMTPPQPVNSPGGEKVGIPGAPAKSDGFNMPSMGSFKPPQPVNTPGGEKVGLPAVPAKGSANEQGARSRAAPHKQGTTIKGDGG